MIRSPLRYPGGKNRVVKNIQSLIPPYKEYREPFLGGGSVFVNQKQQMPEAKFWVNDLYTPVYVFWKMVRDDIDAVVNRVIELRGRSSDGKDLFWFLKNNYEGFSDVDKAAAFFIFNRITFSGISDAGGYSDESFRKRFTESSIERLKKLKDIMDEEVRVTNMDYQEMVEESGENVFLFLDPPYYTTTRSGLYGKNGKLHKDFDHERFAEVMGGCEHKWLITYDDSEYIRYLFSFANIISWDTKYGMKNVTNNSDQKGKELFIFNYDVERGGGS